MKKILAVALLALLTSQAQARPMLSVCGGDTHDSQDYISKRQCDFDRMKALYYGQTKSPICYHGWVYYYYCIKNA